MSLAINGILIICLVDKETVKDVVGINGILFTENALAWLIRYVINRKGKVRETLDIWFYLNSYLRLGGISNFEGNCPANLHNSLKS